MLTIFAMAASAASGIPIAGPGRNSPADFVVALIPKPVAQFMGEWGLVWMGLMWLGILIYVLNYDPKDANESPPEVEP